MLKFESYGLGNKWRFENMRTGEYEKRRTREHGTGLAQLRLPAHHQVPSSQNRHILGDTFDLPLNIQSRFYSFHSPRLYAHPSPMDTRDFVRSGKEKTKINFFYKCASFLPVKAAIAVEKNHAKMLSLFHFYYSTETDRKMFGQRD